MGRIFIGLVKCGAWGCFDEFNRLKEDQLSAVSQQIQVIQTAIKERTRDDINLLGTDVQVNHNAGIFVTMNPAGKGYGGRSRLPDNLKQLFRSVAMSVPDNDLIAESILYSEGFEHATYLAKKLVSIFTLCKQLLSPAQVCFSLCLFPSQTSFVINDLLFNDIDSITIGGYEHSRLYLLSAEV